MQYEVTPNELMLAISIPTNREEFEKQLLQADCYDYIPSVARRYPGLSREGLWNLLVPTIKVCNYVAREAESLGVLVLKGFNSTHFEQALLGRRVATIVAHWRSALLTPEDILDSKPILSEIETADDRVCEVLRHFMTQREADFPEMSATSLLVAAMNRCVQPPSAEGNISLTSYPADLLNTTGLSRTTFEDRFSGHIVRSRDIELADGLTSVGEFISAIPASFDGVLDLTICNSVILGNAVKRFRPAITVAMNQRAASARNRLVLYLAIVRELKREPQLFGDAAVKIRNIIRRICK